MCTMCACSLQLLTEGPDWNPRYITKNSFYIKNLKTNYKPDPILKSDWMSRFWNVHTYWIVYQRSKFKLLGNRNSSSRLCLTSLNSKFFLILICLVHILLCIYTLLVQIMCHAYWSVQLTSPGWRIWIICKVLHGQSFTYFLLSKS